MLFDKRNLGNFLKLIFFQLIYLILFLRISYKVIQRFSQKLKVEIIFSKVGYLKPQAMNSFQSLMEKKKKKKGK